MLMVNTSTVSGYLEIPVTGLPVHACFFPLKYSVPLIHLRASLTLAVFQD